MNMFKKKDIVNDIINEYKTNPEGAIKYIDTLRASKEYKYDDKKLSDSTIGTITIREKIAIVGTQIWVKNPTRTYAIKHRIGVAAIILPL